MYIKDKDEHQMHDNWLQGLSNDAIKKAKAARERLTARLIAIDALDDGSGLDETSVIASILHLMNQRESVAAASSFF